MSLCLASSCIVGLDERLRRIERQVAKSSYRYRERDYTFGNYCVTLRTAIGVTQEELARMLGVSERAIQTWEGGLSYPKVEHFKHFLELCVHYHVFPKGQERDEARTLWKLARLKVLFDEEWMQSLLSQEEIENTAVSLSSLLTVSGTSTRVDWGQAFDVSNFYGREWELQELTRRVVDEQCRVVGVLGMGGIGKSALSITLMHSVASQFQAVVWRSLRDAPLCEDLLADLLQILSPQTMSELPDGFSSRLDLLLDVLRSHRCLLVLDNLETLLQEGAQEGLYRAGYEGYGQLIQRVGEMAHRSCLILTSREKPQELIALDGLTTPVRSLQIMGLDESAGEAILREKGLKGSIQARLQLIAAYSGNPLALKIVAESIRELFEGDIAAFLAENVLLFRGIRTLLAQQFARLTPLEQNIMFWLAIMREPVEPSQLSAAQVISLSRLQLLESLETLRHHSLVEHIRTGFMQQSVVLEYVTAVLVQRVSEEIQSGDLRLLCSHALEQGKAKEYIRRTQERILIEPVLTNLRAVYTSDTNVTQRLMSLLDQLRGHSTKEQGYAPTNIVMLLYHVQGHLRDIDLSRLALREAYLQGVEMQRASLEEAMLQDVAFTDAFNIVTAVATSSVGRHWAAGSTNGEIRLWHTENNTLYFVTKAHTNVVALAFTPDGRILASAGRDRLIKLWDVESKALLRTLRGHESFLQDLDFTLDGQTLASCDAEGTIRLWNIATGVCLKCIEVQQEPAFGLRWHPAGQLLACGYTDSTIRLWDSKSGECLHTFLGHEHWVVGVDFSPDGKLLASGSYDTTIKLWNVDSGMCVKTLLGHTSSVQKVVFSPDGAMLASCSSDASVRLWMLNTSNTTVGDMDVDYRTLSGHKDGVNSIAFAHYGATILSGSHDGTIREWEVVSGQTRYVVEGYKDVLYDVAYSPDGKELASGGLDTTLILWNVVDGVPTARLRGHSQLVYSVAWSPDGHDGRRIASGSFDRTVRIWNTQTGQCTHILQGHTGLLYGVAWHPDGQLLASVSNDRTVRVWDIPRASCKWVHGPVFSPNSNALTWSPDGHSIACVAEDGSIALLDVEDGTVYQTLGKEYLVHDDVEVLAWSPDGTHLVSGGGTVSEGKMFLWDVRSGQLLRRFSGHQSYIHKLGWLPDGAFIVGADNSRTLYLWSVEQEVYRMHYQGTTISSFSISPDGKTIAICSRDTITLLDTHTFTPQGTLRLDRPYEHLTIMGIQGISDAQRASLFALGAIDTKDFDAL